MAGLDRGELNARMLEAARRLAAALVDGGTPRVSERHREYSHVIQAGLDRTTRAGEQGAADIDRAGSAQSDRAAAHAATGAHVREPVRAPDSTAGTRSTNTISEDRTHPDGSDRFELSPEEGRELYEGVRNLEPDFTGTGNRVNRVETSVGPAVVRFESGRPIETFVKKWLPENTAISYGRECGVRTPRLLYSGTDPSTGKDFTIMQYVPGETRGFDDPELMSWLPDLLGQVKSLSSHPLPKGLEMDIPTWQQQMIQHADSAYHNLAPEHRARLDQLGLGPLSDYIRPDPSRAGEPTFFAHNDLFPGNIQFDEQGKVWILDWACAGPSDPLYDAGFFIERALSSASDDVAPATAMWLDRVPLANPDVDAKAVLRTYQAMEDWRGMAMVAEKVPRTIAEDPGKIDYWSLFYNHRLSRHREPPWPDLSKDEVTEMLRGWE
ncbi:aminoglycoside phosphotransferase family protein [Nocardia sienata]|uniref:aminoglycoside phosphotransferase family protein n=1 Tax=Nocardia sienata TaxID=248552 RepID=UPI0007A3760C|nr:aminoglycoside phosphotransferase family protein [Nocardia sienata]